MNNPRSSEKNPEAGTPSELVLGMDELTELELNLHWSWNNLADK